MYRFLQFRNALAPSSNMFSGSLSSYSPDSANASAFIRSRLLGSSILCSAAHPANACLPISRSRESLSKLTKRSDLHSSKERPQISSNVDGMRISAILVP